MYGAGPKKISEQVTKDSGKYFSQQEAKEVIDDYFQSFHALKKWINDNHRFIEQNGFVYSFFGRKRRLPNVKSSDAGIKSHSIRSGLNFLVQSAASDINLLGAIDMHDDIKTSNMKARIFALVHDSILAEVPEDEIELYCEKLKHWIQKDRGSKSLALQLGATSRSETTTQWANSRNSMAYSDKVIDHYERPRNVGRLDQRQLRGYGDGWCTCPRRCYEATNRVVMKTSLKTLSSKLLRMWSAIASSSLSPSG